MLEFGIRILNGLSVIFMVAFAVLAGYVIGAILLSLAPLAIVITVGIFVVAWIIGGFFK